MKPIALADHISCSAKQCLPKSCSVAGWGQISLEKTSMHPKLMEVNVTLIDEEECSEKHAFCSDGEKGPGKVITNLHTNLQIYLLQT